MSGLTKKELGIAALVVAIIGGGLYYKVFIPRREEARFDSCYSNLRRIGLAMEQYAYDNDGTWPRAWFGKNSGPSNATTNYKWMDAIFPYVKHEEIFHCPTDFESKTYRFRSGANYGSYAMNNAYFAPGDNLTPPVGKRMSEIADNMTVLVVEGNGNFQFGWATTVTPTNVSTNGFSFDVPGIKRRHKLGHSSATMWTNGLVQRYGIRQVAAPKTINGQTIYTGFTIEKD